MSTFHPSTSKSLTSTPLKSKSDSKSISIHQAKSMEYDSTGDSTYSLLSPIFHDSFEASDDEHEVEPQQINTSVTLSENAIPTSPSRDEEQLFPEKAADPEEEHSSLKLNLSAWEQWIVCKAKEERLKMEKKAVEELTLKEVKEQQERLQQKKKMVTEGKIQEWLNMKREQEKQEKQWKESQQLQEIHSENQKRLDIEQKAKEKYKEWLRKKKQEEKEKKLREEMEAAEREQKDRERRQRAEEKFKEWLKSVQDQGRRNTSCCSAVGYDNLNYPAPSFVNPIPWKHIHVPQSDRMPKKNSARRRQPGLPKYQSTPCITYKPKDTLSFACKRR